ncbi:MAG: dicarboxylate/amino acid:cation symporter [Oscillospiraceae bacterium]|nr:dicarboxylate/amino acid:cation symporter [Oscillospiraceae bacterium]MBR2799682.1 dicarboxylate/amino acid:cation symporter [Oscillospiraceae bacterium]MBR2807586.1 dicarboxylate/amino acid:cation symporter [Oscillospiraceae bacterium]
MQFWKKLGLGTKIIIGIVIGIIIGLVSPAAAKFISPLGDIFLRMLKMLIVPLVFFSITSGICKMGDVKQLRNVGLRYVLWIVISAVFAATVGMVAALIVQPGKGTTDFLAGAEAAEAASYSFIDNVVSWFPTNIVESMVNANLLQIIVFSLFLGIALLALGEKAAALTKVIDQASVTMLKITEYVIAFSPFGIMSLMATLVNTVSGAAMVEVIKFIVLDNVVGLILLVLFPLIIKIFAKLPPMRFMKKISTPILVAVSTCSSAATLPVSIDTCEKKLGIPENIYGFTLPLGNTCGMVGFAMFLGMACVFASNLYGFPITVGSMINFIFLGLILSIGAAGVKGAGVVMSGVLLSTLGMPLTLIPILAAIWPAIDPCHTTLNNVGDLVGTTIVARQLDRMDMDVFNSDEDKTAA